MRCRAVIMIAALLMPGHDCARAEPYRNQLIARYIETHVKPWVESPDILKLLKSKNELHAPLREADIQFLDRRWRDERASGHYHLIESVLSDPVSRFLGQKAQSSSGIITEILLMDSHGLNVAVSGIPSDYWQGDEAKFQRSFEVGAHTLFIDQPERDLSTQILQTQASMTITDESGTPIGAITVGINLDYL